MSDLTPPRRGWSLLLTLGGVSLALLLGSRDPYWAAGLGLVAAAFVAEFSAKSREIARLVAEAGAQVLPPEHRAGFRDEWLRDLADPSHVDRPIDYAVDLLTGVPRLAWELWGEVVVRTHDDESPRTWPGRAGGALLLAACGWLPAHLILMLATGEAPDLSSTWYWVTVLPSAAGPPLMASPVLDSRRPGRRLDVRTVIITAVLSLMLSSGALTVGVIMASSAQGALWGLLLMPVAGALSAVVAELMWALGSGRFRPRDAVVYAMVVMPTSAMPLALLFGSASLRTTLMLLAPVVLASGVVCALAITGLSRLGVTTWLLVPEFADCVRSSGQAGCRARSRLALFDAWVPEFYEPGLALDMAGLPYGPITDPERLQLIEQMSSAVPALPLSSSSLYGALAVGGGISTLRIEIRDHFAMATEPEVQRIVQRVFPS